MNQADVEIQAVVTEKTRRVVNRVVLRQIAELVREANQEERLDDLTWRVILIGFGVLALPLAAAALLAAGKFAFQS